MRFGGLELKDSSSEVFKGLRFNGSSFEAGGWVDGMGWVWQVSGSVEESIRAVGQKKSRLRESGGRADKEAITLNDLGDIFALKIGERGGGEVPLLSNVEMERSETWREVAPSIAAAAAAERRRSDGRDGPSVALVGERSK